MNCNEAVAALVATLESGGSITEEQRRHIHECERCRQLLESVRQFENVLSGNGIEAPAIDVAVTAAAREVRRRHQRRRMLGMLAILAVAWAAIAFLLVRAGEAEPPEAMLVAVGGVVVAILVAIPVVLLFSLVRSSRDGARPLYKRLKPGRQISGVCLGIAERTGINVSLLRLVFLLAMFFHGLGFWLYLILDLAMPVHPDDRQHLLRFRLRRWWQRRMTHAEG